MLDTSSSERIQAPNGDGTDGRRDSFANGAVPIVLGITGHCEIPQSHHALVRGELLRQFNALKSEFPHSPMVLISSLAPGADCLAAEAARDCGFHLIAPLPLPLAEIEKDHRDAGSSKLHDLVQYAGESCYELLSTEQANSISLNGASRKECYRRASTFVASESQILFAVWDGDWDNAESTTAFTVASKLKGVPRQLAENRDTLEHIDSGIVFHINVTDRFAGDSNAKISTISLVPMPDYIAEIDATSEDATAGASPHKIFTSRNESDGLIPPDFKRVLENIDRYNADAAEFALRSDAAAKLAQSQSYLLGGEPPALCRHQQKLVKAYTVADVLAGLNKISAHRQFVSLGTVVFTASLMFIWFGDYETHFRNDSRAGADLLWLLGLSSILLGGYWIYRRLNRNKGRFQDRFQDYRALAEGLRVQIYWSLVGIDESAATYYMNQQKTELDWIRAAIRTFQLHPTIVGEANSDRLNYVANLWISCQYDYFVGAHKREERSHQRHERFINGLAICAISCMALATVVLAIIHHYEAAEHMDHVRNATPWAYHFDRVKEVSLLIIDSLFVFAGLARVSSEAFALEHHVKQYLKMRNIYARARKRFIQYRAAQDIPSMRRLFKDLGKMALAENGEWLLLHRERRLEMDPHL